MKQHFYKLFLTGLLISQNVNLAAQPLLPSPKAPNSAGQFADEFPLFLPNGWDLLVQGTKALKGDEGPISITEKPEEAAQLLKLKRAYVEQNAEALRLIKEGLRHSAHRKPINEMEVNSSVRKLGRLLTYKSQIAAADEKWDEAKNALLDEVRLGIVSARGGVFIAHITGIIMQNGALNELKKLVPRLSADQLREAAKILESIYATRLTYSEALEAETWFSLSQFQEIFTESTYQTYRNDTLLKDIFKDTFKEATPEQIARFRARSEWQITIAYLTAMNDYIEKARVPYNQQPEFDASNLDALGVLFVGNITNKQARITFARNDARLAICLTQLALQGYKHEKGIYPNTLQELTPNFLTKMPIDPFGEQTLQYRRAGESYLLYSVGPDGIDNNGAPIDNKPPLIKEADERARRQILPESIGDMVADINK